MGDINWGLLQNSAPPIEHAQPMASPAPSPMAPAGGGGSNLASVMQQRAELAEKQNEFKQTIGLERDKFGLLQNQDARQAQEAADIHAKQPGLLQEQQLKNQGQGLANTGQDLANQTVQTNLQTLQMDRQRQIAWRQANDDAFQKGKNQGGTEGGLDAVQEEMANHGDIESSLKLAQTRADLKKSVQANTNDEATASSQQIAELGKTIGNMMQQVKPPVPPQTDPKTGKLISPGSSGVSAKDLYTQQYDMIKQQYPNAPDPRSFRDDQQFQDTFVHPVLEKSLPIIHQNVVEVKAMQQSDLYKAQQVTTQNQNAFNQAVKQYGPNDQRTIQAATALQQSQKNAARIASGNNYVTGTVAAAKSVLPTWLGGDKSPQQMANDAAQGGTSEQPGQAGSMAPAVAPQGQPSQPTQPGQGQPVTKTIGNNTYMFQNGKWYQQ